MKMTASTQALEDVADRLGEVLALAARARRCSRAAASASAAARSHVARHLGQAAAVVVGLDAAPALQVAPVDLVAGRSPDDARATWPSGTRMLGAAVDRPRGGQRRAPAAPPRARAGRRAAARSRRACSPAGSSRGRGLAGQRRRAASAPPRRTPRPSSLARLAVERRPAPRACSSSRPDSTLDRARRCSHAATSTSSRDALAARRAGAPCT